MWVEAVMFLRKLPDEYKTVPIKCPVCNACRVYIEGPNAGMCLYGGPYKGRTYVHPDNWNVKEPKADS